MEALILGQINLTSFRASAVYGHVRRERSSDLEARPTIHCCSLSPHTAVPAKKYLAFVQAHRSAAAFATPS